MKTQGVVDDNPCLHQVLLAYISDFRLMGTALIPHGITLANPKLQAASLDHSLWIHAPFRVDEWLYYHMESPLSASGRGLNFGKFYTRDGTLIASTAQEGLIRLR